MMTPESKPQAPTITDLLTEIQMMADNALATEYRIRNLINCEKTNETSESETYMVKSNSDDIISRVKCLYDQMVSIRNGLDNIEAML